MKNLILLGVIAIQFGCAQFTREVCPPDNYPVYVPKDCTEGFEIYAKAYEVKVSLEIKTAEVNAKSSIEITKKIVELAEQLNQSTVRFRTTFIGLCQSQVSNPCNQAFQDKILKARTELSIHYENISGKLEKITTALETANNTAGALEVKSFKDEILNALDEVIQDAKKAGT